MRRRRATPLVPASCDYLFLEQGKTQIGTIPIHKTVLLVVKCTPSRVDFKCDHADRTFPGSYERKWVGTW